VFAHRLGRAFVDHCHRENAVVRGVRFCLERIYYLRLFFVRKIEKKKIFFNFQLKLFNFLGKKLLIFARNIGKKRLFSTSNLTFFFQIFCPKIY
jgi:hypothetical protein